MANRPRKQKAAYRSGCRSRPHKLLPARSGPDLMAWRSGTVPRPGRPSGPGPAELSQHEAVRFPPPIPAVQNALAALRTSDNTADCYRLLPRNHYMDVARLLRLSHPQREPRVAHLSRLWVADNEPRAARDGATTPIRARSSLPGLASSHRPTQIPSLCRAAQSRQCAGWCGCRLSIPPFCPRYRLRTSVAQNPCHDRSLR